MQNLDIAEVKWYIGVPQKRGGSSVWLERLPVTQEVAGSSPVRPARSPDFVGAFSFLSTPFFVYIIQSQRESMPPTLGSRREIASLYDFAYIFAVAEGRV